MNKVLILLVLLVATACASSTVKHTAVKHKAITPEFLEYVKKYNKQYGPEEMLVRAATFAHTVAIVNAHNADPTQTYKKGINQFTDWTEDEFKNWLPLLPAPLKGALVEHIDLTQGAPDSWDWRAKGAVNAVKDQGQCGWCWAFGSTAAVETAHFIASGQLLSLSESQQVICNTAGGCNECAFQYLQTHGACEESSFPYQCPDTRACPACTPVTPHLKNYTVLPASNEAALQIGVARQVVAIGIAASGDFQSYSSGIFQGPCPGGRNHAVAIVGYGSENGMDYWIIRNSWGSGWGEAGYIRIRRNVPDTPDGLCLLATDASVPGILNN